MKRRHAIKAKSRSRLRAFVNETVSIIAGRLVAELGVDQAKADELARNCAHDICARYGGSFMYVAKDVEFDLTKRDREIFDRYNGINMAELVAEYGITHVRIYQIVAQIKAELVGKMQGRLGFDEDDGTGG